MSPEPYPRSPGARRRQVVLALFCLVLAIVLALRFTPRPAFLQLATHLDGPPPARATGLVILLHGRGGSLRWGRKMIEQLRTAGLPSEVLVLLVEGPYPAWLGHHFGDSSEAQALTRARLRALLDQLGLGASGPPAARVVIAGFSQGAGLAIDMAVEDSRIGGLASFSPCRSELRGELSKREQLRVLLAHGAADATCPVLESRSLARVLEAAHRPVRYIEFDGPHTIPPEVVRALVELATAP